MARRKPHSTEGTKRVTPDTARARETVDREPVDAVREPRPASEPVPAVKKENTMQDAGKAQEVFNQATSKALETVTLFAEANQRVLRDMAELSAGAAKEGFRLYAELQQSAIDAMREGQAAAIRWQSYWQEGPKDPVQWYQKALAESVEGTQKWFRLVEANAQAVTKSAERIQASAEQVGKGIQETYSGVVTKMKDGYATATA